MTGSQTLFGTPPEIARRLRERIAAEVGLPSSAGIAPVKFAAKIASDLAKPNGQREVPGDVAAFLAPLPVSRLWGVGPKTEEVLLGLGLKTIGAVAACDPARLLQRLGDAGEHLYELSRGRDDRPVVPDREAKSMGAEDTFEDDVADPELLRSHLHSQALRVGRRLRRAGVKTRVVQLKVKFSDFTALTRRATLEAPTDDGQRLYREAMALFSRVPAGRSVRLTGVSAQDLSGEPGQLPLFRPAPARSQRLNQALDRIAERYGSKAVTTADLVEEAPSDDDDLRHGVGASRLDAVPPKRGG